MDFCPHGGAGGNLIGTKVKTVHAERGHESTSQQANSNGDHVFE